MPSRLFLHELTHCALGPGVGHSATFWTAFRAAAREAFGIGPLATPLRKYDKHKAIEDAVRAALNAGRTT